VEPQNKYLWNNKQHRQQSHITLCTYWDRRYYTVLKHKVETSQRIPSFCTHNFVILIPCWLCFVYVKPLTFVFRGKSTNGPRNSQSWLSFYFHPSRRNLPSCLCARGKRISPSPCSFPISSGTSRIRVITPPCGTNFISRSYESVVCLALLDYTVCAASR
jgi:hypothetical protein